MRKSECVNEAGYKALRSLADTQPELFTQPDPNRLREAMRKDAGTENIWRETVALECSLEPLNSVRQSGPDTDAYYARIVREALSRISLSDASDELLWASVNCFAVADYVPKRWDTSNTRNTKPGQFVDRHWLRGGPDGRESNAVARLWWLGEISERVSRFSKYSADELLDAMANNVNLYHQTLARRYIVSNPRLVAAIYDIAIDGNEHLFQTKHANQMFKSINVRAGATALDLLEDDDLRAIVKEALPPKG